MKCNSQVYRLFNDIELVIHEENELKGKRINKIKTNIDAWCFHRLY